MHELDGPTLFFGGWTMLPCGIEVEVRVCVEGSDLYAKSIPFAHIKASEVAETSWFIVVPRGPRQKTTECAINIFARIVII